MKNKVDLGTPQCPGTASLSDFENAAEKLIKMWPYLLRKHQAPALPSATILPFPGCTCRKGEFDKP